MNKFILAVLLTTSFPAWGQDDVWDSIDPNGNVIRYDVPEGGELFRLCMCTQTQGLRTCECTKPASTIAEAAKQPTEIDVQRQVGLSLQTAPYPVMRSAGRP